MVRRPVFRAPGGKFRLAPWIVSHAPWREAYDFYVETHAFAASVFFQMPKTKSEVLNDINDAVTDTFEVLRDEGMSRRLEEQLRLTPLSYTEYKRSYRLPPTEDKVEKARRLIFQSFATIGTDGIIRADSGFRGLKNFESGITAAQEWSTYPDAIQSFRRRLKGVLLENRDALKVIDIYDSPRTYFYLDPPYPLKTRSRSRPYYKFEMTDEQHEELLKRLLKIEGMAIISSYRNDMYYDYLREWRFTSIKARAQGNAEKEECLWISPNIDGHTQKQLFS